MDSDGETETARKWPLPFEQPGPAVRIHLAPPHSLNLQRILRGLRQKSAHVGREKDRVAERPMVK